MRFQTLVYSSLSLTVILPVNLGYLTHCCSNLKGDWCKICVSLEVLLDDNHMLLLTDLNLSLLAN